MPAKKTLFMETTAIPPEKTVGEISACLIQAGATQISTTFKDGEILGLLWTMKASGGRELLFKMPARVEPVFKVLNGRRKSQWDREDCEHKDREQAKRVAWRQLLRWVQAQMAMIDTGMAEAAEVFFAYIQSPSGQTLFEHFKEQEYKALPAPEERPQ